MAKRKANAPSRTQEDYESKIINMAYHEAERRITDGTASSQLITHFLREGTEKARLERERLRAETELAMEKAAAVRAQQSSDELLEKALAAFSTYRSSAEADYNEVQYAEDLY